MNYGMPVPRTGWGPGKRFEDPYPPFKDYKVFKTATASLQQTLLSMGS